MAVLSLTGLGQVLEFMYTAKLSLSPENVDDVLAVASFLQMQDIITACHALKSLAEPSSSTGEDTEVSAVEGKGTGKLFLKSGKELGFLWRPCQILGHLTESSSTLPSLWGAGKGWPCTPGKGLHACPFLPLSSREQEPHLGRWVSWKPADSHQGQGPLLSTIKGSCPPPAEDSDTKTTARETCGSVTASVVVNKPVKYLEVHRGT